MLDLLLATNLIQSSEYILFFPLCGCELRAAGWALTPFQVATFPKKATCKKKNKKNGRNRKRNRWRIVLHAEGKARVAKQVSHFFFFLSTHQAKAAGNV